MTIKHLHALWRTLRNRSDASLDASFRDLHPLATPADFRSTRSLATELGFISAGAHVAEPGKRFAKLPHWRTWQPDEEQKKILAKHKIDFVEALPSEARPVIVDLFSGAGGLSLGFEMAGFKCGLAVDDDAQAADAHKKNFPNCETVHEDIKKIAADDCTLLRKRLGKEIRVAGVVGGPPCQGFSYIGERVVADERNMLTSYFMDVVLALKPDFFVMENVAGILNSGARPKFAQHLGQYAKSIGPAATQIAESLPACPKAANKRERQYNKRLVSAAVQEYQHALAMTGAGATKSSDIARQSAVFRKILIEHLRRHFSKGLLLEAESTIHRNTGAVCLLGISSLVCAAVRSEKDRDTKAESIIQGLTADKSEIGKVSKDLLKQFRSLDTMASYKGVSVGPVLRHLIERAEQDYNITAPKLLSSAWYGAPQDRRRVFLVGVRKDLKSHFEFPAPTHRVKGDTKSAAASLTAVTCREAIGDLPDVDEFELLIEGDAIPSSAADPRPSAFSRCLRLDSLPADATLPRPSWDPFQIDCCKRTLHSNHVVARLEKTGHGVLDETSGKTRLNPDDVAHTLRAGTREGKGSHTAVRPIHYSLNRVITVREGARLMGWPDWMTFHPTKWHGFRLVGNGVPGQLGFAIARSLRALLYQSHRAERRLSGQASGSAKRG